MAKYSVDKLRSLVRGEWLQQVDNLLEIRYLLIDSRKVVNGDQACFFALEGTSHDGHKHVLEAYKKGARCFVVAHKINLEQLVDANVILVNDTLLALQSISKHHRDQFQLPVIAITGSNGKTIVKEWLGQIIKEKLQLVKSPKSYNSKVGVPLSIWQCNTRHQLGLFEAGISQPGEMSVLENLISPDVGLITNIGTAHDENFNSKSQKAEEKFLLFKHCDQVVYCKDDIEVNRQAGLLDNDVKLFSWSKEVSADLSVKHVEIRERSALIDGIYKGDLNTVQIPFSDAASVENAIHCWALLLCLGYTQEFISAGLLRLSPVAMRLELKEGINNCSLVNDYYNSDLVSLEIALDFVEHQQRHQNKTLILSDILETGEDPKQLYKKINKLLVSKGINRLIGIGSIISSSASCFTVPKEFYDSTSVFLRDHELNSFSEETILLKGARPFCFEKISEQLQKQFHNTVLEVNLSAVQHNLNYFKSKLNSEVKLMAMVKAYSYGAGAFEVANLLQFNKIDYLGVAYADEGVALRKAGITVPIMVMNPEVDAYEKMIKHKLEPEIYNFSTLIKFTALLEKQLLDQAYPIHLKIDTGMHRLGFSREEVPKLIEDLKLYKGVSVQSVFSHLATADDVGMLEHTENQILSFTEVTKKFKGIFQQDPFFHILNSAGILTLPNAQFDMVRLGLGLYGISSLTEHTKHLQEVSALKTTISQIKDLPSGEAVGYSRAAVLKTDAQIATIPIGYADGMRRSLGNSKGHVLIKGEKASIVGNVCMDMCMIDVTGLDAKEGDEVIIFGEGLQIILFAKNMDTIPYEALTGISPRVKRVYFQE